MTALLIAHHSTSDTPAQLVRLSTAELSSLAQFGRAAWPAYLGVALLVVLVLAVVLRRSLRSLALRRLTTSSAPGDN